MTNIWKTLDRISEGVALECVWRRTMGDEFPVWRSAFLYARPERAEDYPCPEQCGCIHRVVEHSPTHIVAVCECDPWNCENIPLQAEDLIYWQLNLPRFGRAMAQALDIERRDHDTGVWGTTGFGSWSADAVPVILAQPSHEVEFRNMIAQLGVRLQRRFILFTPTNRYLDVRSQELLTHARAACFSLESTFILLPSGLLQARQSAGVLFSAFRPEPQSEVTLADARRLYALVLLGDSEQVERKAPLKTVFDLYCRGGLSADEVAHRCHCSKATIINRLDALQKRTGVSPEKLRAYQPMFRDIEASLTDPRARRIRRQDAIYGENADEELI